MSIKNFISILILLACTSTCLSLAAQESGSNDKASNDAVPNQVKLSTLSERFEISEELIVTVRVGQLNYGEVFAVVGESGLFVNAEELIGLLDFPIGKLASDDGEYQLKGWFISEDKDFELRLFSTNNENGMGEVIIAGKRSFIPLSQYMEIGSEKLINFDLVGSWFGLSLTFDSEKLSVNAIASSPLPAQQKLKREKIKLSARGPLIAKYPNFDFGYFARSHQMFDASINTYYRQDSFSSNYSVVGIQDIAGLSTRFFAQGTNRDFLESANINFKRQSLDANLLGPLHATTIEFGDIRSPRVAGLTNGQAVGISIGNEKLGQAYDFEFTNVTGVIQQGWDVELYQNGVLIRKDLNTSGGQYEFLDVPLFAQLNTFDVVKYGPQGQVERERVERNLDDQTFSETPRYNVSLTRSNTSLLSDSNLNAEQDLLLSGAYNYSFVNWLSTSFSHNINLSDSSGTYALGTTVRLSPRLLSNFSYTYSNADQQSLGFLLQSSLFDQFVNLRINRSFQEGDAYTDSASLRMLGNLYQGYFGRLSYGNEFRGGRTSNGDYFQNLTNTLTLTTNYGFFSHNFNHKVERNNDIQQSFSSGAITIGGTQGNFNTRFSANYELSPVDNSINWLGVDASLNYEFYNDLSTQFKVSRALANNFDSYQWSVQWQQPSYAVFGSISHNSNNDTSVALNARFSMSEAPFGRGYITSGTPLATNALVAVRVYEDVNQNFVFDAADRPLPNVKVSAEQLTRFAKSGEDGVAIFEGIASFRQTDLKVDLKTLDDPYLMQSTINTSLTPREGLLTLINYPFVQGIEFEGELTVNLTKDGGVEALKNAPIEIYRSNGELATTIRSEYDGYFYSGLLFPDIYTLKVSDEYLSRNEVAINQVVVVSARKSGSFIPDIKIKGDKINYQESYQPYIAAFSVESVAKTYFRYVLKKYADIDIDKSLSVYKSRKDNKYYVGFSVYENESEAKEFCQIISQMFSSCKVNKDRYKYSFIHGEN